MIDLEKEREAFEINWLSLGGKLDNFEYTTDQMYSLSKEASKKLSEQDKLISIMIINQSWSYWLNFARSNQAEITELKQQLSEAHASRASWVEYSQKVESGEFTLIENKKLTTWYLDEQDGMYWDFDGIDGGFSNLDAGEVVTVERLRNFTVPDVYVTRPWEDGDVGFWKEYATKEEAEKIAQHCKAMIEAVEKDHE